MTNGSAPPDVSNDSLGIFLREGSSDEDTASSVKRSAENTRPLGPKNTDNKAIAAAVNHATAYSIAKWADTQQNCFLCGRHGQTNTIDIDAKARIRDIEASAMILKPDPQQKQTIKTHQNKM